MKSPSALLLLLSLVAAPSAEPEFAKIVNVSEVDPRSVSLTAVNEPVQNVNFRYVSKSPQEVRVIARQHTEAPVLVMKDGVIVAKAVGCTGYKGLVGPDKHLDYVGLVLIFENAAEAKRAEKALRSEAERKQ